MNFADISCSLHKLKIKQGILEKNESDFIKSIIANYGIDLDGNYTLKTQREQLLSSLQKDVCENNKILHELQSTVSPENIAAIDLLALKHKMMTLEHSIQSIQNQLSKDMETLMKEENLLSIEVINLDIKYSETNKHIRNKIPLRSSKSKSENLTLYQEVKDFADFVNETGGHEGGWSQNDHLIFVRYFNQIKSRMRFIKVLRRFLPDISEEKIENHIEWYNKYKDLRENQKKAIVFWRQNKSTIDNGIEMERSQNPDENKKKENNNIQRQCVKDKISKWKWEKQQKQQQEIEKIIRNQSAKSKNNEKEKKQKEEMKNEVKKEIDKWRTSIKAEERAERLEQELRTLREKERKITMANRLIREFQNQDSMYIMRRINMHNSKTANFFPPVRNKGTRKDNRNPERIFKATQQWISRVAISSSNESSENSMKSLFAVGGHMNVQQIPKLGVPAWRVTTR